MTLRQPYTSPVHMSQGQLISPFLCQLTVHGLPPGLARHDIGQQLLSRAGYTSQECSVEGEFMGDLPTQYASQQVSAMLMLASYSSGRRRETGSSYACRRASASGRREYTHTQPLTADSQVVTHREPASTACSQTSCCSRAQPCCIHSQAHQMQSHSRGCHSQVSCTHSRIPQMGSGLQLPFLLQGLQLPVLRLLTVGFPAHSAGPPVPGPRSAQSCRLSRPL